MLLNLLYENLTEVYYQIFQERMNLTVSGVLLNIMDRATDRDVLLNMPHEI